MTHIPRVGDLCALGGLELEVRDVMPKNKQFCTYRDTWQQWWSFADASAFTWHERPITFTEEQCDKLQFHLLESETDSYSREERVGIHAALSFMRSNMEK